VREVDKLGRRPRAVAAKDVIDDTALALIERHRRGHFAVLVLVVPQTCNYGAVYPGFNALFEQKAARRGQVGMRLPRKRAACERRRR